MDISVGRRVYSREELLALKWSKSGGSHPIPAEINKCLHGCLAGAKVKARRWRYKPFLPSIIMGRVNSLPNENDELEILVKTQKVYHDCSLMCFNETWLNQNISDSCVDLPGSTLIRSDRDAKTSPKIKGGGDWLYFWIRDGVILFILLSKRRYVVQTLNYWQLVWDHAIFQENSVIS